MEKKVLYITIIGAALAALSCNKEIGNPEDTLVQGGNEVSGETVSFTLSVPESDTGTRTTLGDKDGSAYPVLWSADDVITLNGTAATSFTPESGNASAKATFKLANLSAPYNFLYGGVSGQSAQVSFPATQNYVAGGFDPAALPMYASLASRSDNVTFSHLAALLKFSITGSKKIDSVSLAAADENQSLSGNFTIGTTSGLLDGSLTPVATGAGLIYSFGGHIQLSTTPFEFFIAIPAGTYEGGITLTIVDNDSGSMAVKVLDTDATKTIAAGKVREFNAIEYVPEKEKNLIQIYDATTLNKFRTRVANGETTLNARVTCNAASFSASSIASAWVPIEDYKGIFDGNGKGITGLTKPLFGTLKGVVKNLTLNSTINATAADDLNWGMFAKQIIPSSEVDDVAGLQNCTAQGSLTYTPSSALSSDCQIGGLVGNNKGGTISGCTNEATVTMGDNGQTNASQVSLGGVLGRTQKGGDLSTQGDISNCSNNGTVICDAQLDANLYIGGVLGYQVEKKESMSGSVNHGLVKVGATFSTTKALQLGGVAGLAKGILENCTNASDGTVTSENGSSAGTYFCVGGVVGRLNNDAGLTYETLNNAGVINVAGSGTCTTVYVGGVAGRCNEGALLNGVTNSGDINYSAEIDAHTLIGGITATITATGTSIVNCHSVGGTITYSGVTLCTASESSLYVGGIVGTANKPISSCTNAMTINVGGSFSAARNGYYGTGGIAGRLTGGTTVTDCLNTGNITWSQQLGGSSGYSYLGGIVGYPAGSIIDCSNGGTITFSGKNDAKDPFIGGIAGDTDASYSISGKYSSAVATNFGKVEINTSAQSKKYVYAGGIAGRLRCTLENATNAGKINVTSLTCTSLFLGGVVGTGAAATASIGSGSANLSDGDITISGLTSNQQAYIGGIAGHVENAACTIAGINDGDVIITSGSVVKRSYYVGGIVGRCVAPLSSCTNNGLVSNAARMSGGGDYYMQIGGIVGYNDSGAPISNCHNTGNVENTANSGAYLYIGGITSESDAAISDCTNTGNVSNSGNSGNAHPICIGGIAGVNSAGITGSSNGTSAAVGGTISNSGTSAERLCIGGIYGYSNANGSLSNSFNKGAVTNSGDAPAANAIFLGGAIGFQHNNADNNDGIASVITYVDNFGAVFSNSSVTSDLQMGGIAAEAWGSVDHCTNSGPVTVNNDVAKALYMGGILGWWETNSSNSVTYCENKATGTILVVGGTNIEKQFFVSGVIGGERGEIETTNSHLINRAEVTLDESITSSSIGATTYSYLSGVGGGSGSSYVRYEYCENYGEIWGKCKHRARVGGVVACAFRSPDHSKCVANIRYLCTRGGNYKSDEGGVIGYYKAETDNTIDDILFKGVLNSNSCSPRAYTGGLVGRVNDDAVTFTDCKVGGQVKGVGSPFNTVALVCCAVSSHEINITNLTVATGTKRQDATVTSLQLNFSSTAAVGVLCNGTTTETNTTTLENASTGTMTNCTIGSIDAYL